jgi:hypothetical protein
MAARDVLFASIVLFIFAIGFFVVYFAINTTITQMNAIPEINQSTDAVDVFNSVSTMTDRLDYVIFGLFVALTLGIIVTGWFVGGITIFMILYIIVIIIGVAMSAIMSNVWETVSTAVQFGTTVLAFPITNHLLLNLPYYVSVMGFIGLLVMFAKPYFAKGG